MTTVFAMLRSARSSTSRRWARRRSAFLLTQMLLPPPCCTLPRGQSASDVQSRSAPDPLATHCLIWPVALGAALNGMLTLALCSAMPLCVHRCPCWQREEHSVHERAAAQRSRRERRRQRLRNRTVRISICAHLLAPLWVRVASNYSSALSQSHALCLSFSFLLLSLRCQPRVHLRQTRRGHCVPGARRSQLCVQPQPPV